MLYPSSSRLLFDTMFALLFVAAGASVHSVNTNGRKEPANLGNSFSKSSLMELLLDPDFVAIIKNSTALHDKRNNTVRAVYHRQVRSNHSSATSPGIESRSICELLMDVLDSPQKLFCHRHHDVLDIVLPSLYNMTRFECVSITQDLRWNCANLLPFLDRNNYLAYTRESALIKSLVNASMMILILQTCSRFNHLSCGCSTNERSDGGDTSGNNVVSKEDPHDIRGSANTQQVTFKTEDIVALNRGQPVRLANYPGHFESCRLNYAFAEALTRLFLDADDNRSLDNAHRVLNRNLMIDKKLRMNTPSKVHYDLDYRDLSIIKWTKSAIGLHNGNLGRKLVREQVRSDCRCHGISGSCQFRTCWDEIPSIQSISTKLKFAYLNRAFLVIARNLGTFEDPDLYITRTEDKLNSNPLINLTSISMDYQVSAVNNRVNYNELIYLYESPDYCLEQPSLSYDGVRGRPCQLDMFRNEYGSQISNQQIHHMVTGIEEEGSPNRSQDSQAIGFCKEICCSDGYHTYLDLKMIRCNCKFKFCCKIECEYCLRQQPRFNCI